MKITFILFIMNFISGMGYSIISPLFPPLAIKIGLTETIIGIIIGIFDIANTILTTLTPKLCQKFTRIKLLYFSTFGEATCTIIYGIIGHYIKSYKLLIISMLIVRIIHGCCGAIIATLVYSLAISLSDKSETKQAIGYLEVAWCFGISFGPILASVFYQYGGYPLPFIAIGFILYTSVYLSSIVANEKTDSNDEIQEDPPFIKFLLYKEIIVILGAFIFGMVSESFFYPSLTNHLTKHFGLTVKVSSLFFAILAIAYIITLQFLDKTTEKFGLYGACFFGLDMAALGVLMVYPYHPFPQKIFLVAIGLALIGGGGAPIFVPGLVSLTKSIKEITPDLDELSANDVASAIYNLTVAIGNFIGPIIGGYLSTRFGFKQSCLFISTFIFFYSIIYLMYFRDKICRKKNSIITDSKSEEVELMNHPGFFKDKNLNCSFHSDLNLEKIGKRKKYYSSMLKKDEVYDDYPYMNLNDLDQVEKL
jgi:predicted MFS family arabinose efflux permease